LAALLAVSAPSCLAQDDPRIELVALLQQHRQQEALARARQLLDQRPEQAERLGLGVLAAHLLDQLGEEREAAVAFVSVLPQTPRLAGYARYRAAAQQELLGHPEVAAGLVASVVAERGFPALEPEAARLLRRSVLAGGDCRLLGRLDADRYDGDERRTLALTLADCRLRSGHADDAVAGYLGLLADSTADEAALEAAERVAALAGDRPPAGIARPLGLTFYQHREFDRASHYLEPLVGSFDGPLAGDRYELAYTLVRTRFWQERYAAAAAGFAALAARARSDRLVAQALYQQARSHELLGEWPEAAAAFRRAYRTDPGGRFADAALIGALRLEWRAGQDEPALELFDLLTSRREWTEVAARAAIFLAASDLVAGRTRRAGDWLTVAARGGAAAALEVDYWRGRLAELEGHPQAAVRRYLAVLRADYYHPLAQEALVRLRRADLEGAAAELARAQKSTPLDLYEAWLLLAGRPDEQAEVAAALERVLARDGTTRPWVALEPVPIEAWPLWQASLVEPDELLLALGLWADGASAMRRHFPYDEPRLAFTAASLLLGAGEVRRAVAMGETLHRRVPEAVPPTFLAPAFRRLLYPFAFAEPIFHQATHRQVDPHLLIAVIREESRFQPRALSSASARGLSQFVQPTAREVAADLGLGPLPPHALYRPEVAIALGAAYLSRLVEAFDGAEYMAVAAYNAGPSAARLWRSYCVSGEVAEYYSKVSYGETRGYLRRVLGSWMQYRDIYQAAPRIDRWSAGLAAAGRGPVARPAAAEEPPP
jgi:soluble lytic murein transglycosylase